MHKLPPEELAEVEGLDLLPNAAAYEPRIFELIAGARRRLSVLMYIFRPDETGRRFLGALVEAARRGVEVRLVVDAHGSVMTPSRFFDPLRRAGGRVAIFLPQLGRSYLVRMHQKVIAADDGLALVGGFNVGDEYFAPREEDDFRDLGLRVERPEAAAVHAYVERLHAWCAAGRTRPAELRRMLAYASDGSGAVRWLLGGAGDRDSPLRRSLGRDLARAQRLDAIASYFAPPREILALLKGVASRGRLRLVIGGKTDVPLARAAARHYYAGLIDTGCELFEYRLRPLHAKLIVADDVVYVGSPNMDPRSLFTNLELALRIESPALAAAGREVIAAMATRSCAITRGWLARHEKWPGRLAWAMAHALLYRLDYAVCRKLVG